MADTTFTNGVTLTDADWFNDVNRLHYTIFGDPANLAAVRTTMAASDSAAGTIEIAVQSEMEAGSSATLAVTPGRQHFHPSAAKAWAKFNGNTAGTNAPIVGYNVANVTRNSTGNYTINLTNAFSSSDYVVIGNATGNTYAVIFVSSTASSFTIETRLTSTGAVADINPIFVVAFGDL